MQVKSVLLLSFEEAREALVQFYAEVLSDRNHLEEMIRDGSIQKLPNIMTYNPKEVAELFDELGLGDHLCTEHNATQVVIDLKPSWEWQLVWDCENVNPNKPTRTPEQEKQDCFITLKDMTNADKA